MNTVTRPKGRPGEPSPAIAAPALIYLTVIIGVPIVIVVMYSLLSRDRFGVGVTTPFTVDAYVRLLFEEQLSGIREFDVTYLRVLWTSFSLAGLTTVLCIVLSVPIGVWIAMQPARRRPLLVFLVTVPFWTNTLIRTYAFLIILNDNGPINTALEATGLVSDPLPLLYNDFATGVGMVAVFLPFMILPIYASAEKFDFRLAEAAYDLGAKRVTVFRRIVLPAIRPGILAGTALVLIPAMGSFLQPDLLGGGKTLMIGNLVQQQFAASRNWPFGAALSVLLLIVTFVAVLMVSRSLRRSGQQVRLL